MIRRLIQLAGVLLALALSIPAAGAAYTDSQGNLLIRVGLASSSDSSMSEMDVARLENNTGYGAGYRFGYFDSNYRFQELARTTSSQTYLAMIKTTNYYLSGGEYITTPVSGAPSVGCYHVVTGSYSNFESARAAAAQISGGFVAWINGTYQARAGAYLDAASATAAAATLSAQLGSTCTVQGTSSYGVNVLASGTTNILFQFDGGASLSLGIMPDVSGAGDVRTWFKGLKYRGGFSYQRLSGGKLTVVNILKLEDYVKGVAPYEMGREWPLEALKTQATCARTYALKRLNHHGKLGFDVCNTTSCQVYYGVGSNRTDWGASALSDRAVEETAGMVVWYGSTMAETFYSSSHGGASESIYNVWGSSVSQYPYLKGVIDPYEATIADRNENSSWTVQYSAASLLSRLQDRGYGVGSSIQSLEITYSELGNAIEVAVHWKNGQKNTFKPTSIRSVFGLKAIRFTVNGQAVSTGGGSSAGGGYTINGSGSLSSTDGLYVITGNGTVSRADESLSTISGSGTVAALTPQEQGGSNQGGGKVTVSGSSYVFNGSGWGHQLGMSQFGANAMARLGFGYQEIIPFYYPGTTVGAYK